MARLGFTLGNILRETGIALERLGSRIEGDYTFCDPISRHQQVRNIMDKEPAVGQGCFIAPTASVLGSVKVGSGSNVWYGAVVRGDAGKVSIGSNTNIQESAVISTNKSNVDVTIGSNVLVGPRALLGAVTIEDNASIGAGAIVSDGAVVQKGSMVAAGAVVPPNTTVPSGQVFGGSPAKFLRNLSPDESSALAKGLAAYAQLATQHSSEINKTFREIEKEKEGYHWRAKPEVTFDTELNLLNPPKGQIFQK